MRVWLLVAMLLGVAPAWAQTSVTTKHATARLLADVGSVRPGQAATIGLQLKLLPGWHTYWRNPGDAGAPPTLAWTLPTGTTVGDPAFPAPAVLSEGELTTYAHTGTLLLTAPLTVGAGRVAVKLHAGWLVCRDICVPEDADLALDLPAGDGAPSADAPLFAAAVAAQPRPLPAATITPDNVLILNGLSGVRSARFVPDAPGSMTDGAEQRLSRSDGQLRLALHRTAHGPLSGVVLVTGADGVPAGWTVAAMPGPAPIETASIWPTLGLALLGGLLLNLMPCVFPVLALKAAGLAAMGDGTGRARRGALGYGAGTVGTFAALGGALVAARSQGVALGWGFQLQSTPFVLAMAFVLFAVGLNLSGVFAVGAGRMAGLGQGVVARGGLLGDIATGALTVLVAAQCTAPFMAAALARALTAPAAEAVAVFAGLGAGLAAPYVLVAFVPAFRRALPRPGRWMEVLRQALAFPLYAAAGWLAWVAIVQAGSDAALVAMTGAVAVGLSAWLLGRAQAARRPGTRRIVSAIAACGALAAAATLLLPLTPRSATGGEKFSVARLAALRTEGHAVFVDMSAAWCIPCLINERVALAAPSVKAAFSDAGVHVLRGDWTLRNSDISAYLTSQGRDGVPLYQLYPAGGAVPQTLPQLLTPGIVLAALKNQAVAGDRVSARDPPADLTQ